ncbi:MAG: T9SS type B sorting domain-containing protein [Flavobacteriaceae bacterium]|nr:T9SS type B sorting domain-containing protein [Flavobacteriaceae bacterium]
MINKYAFIIFWLIFYSNFASGQAINKHIDKSSAINKFYCPLTHHPIIDDDILLEIDNIATNAVYIQIVAGYDKITDILQLQGVNPNITMFPFDALNGILTLQWSGSGAPTFVDFMGALKNVVYYNNSPNPTGDRVFSITLGSANYLPKTGHYYEFVPSIGITWTDAKIAAEAKTYFGLKGYLATILSLEEANLVGKQTSGAGWIGGSDAEMEGIWKWVTGPENGLVFWVGLSNGNTPNFAFWNTGEPNQYQGANEDYAHITAVGVGILGSWNDLTNTGDISGDYQPKGYLVEYGGMPGDPILRISASTTISIPQIITTIPNSRCEAGIVTLNATSNTGNVYWYANAIGGIPINFGTSFSPNLTVTTTFYVDAFELSCSSGTRTPITATIHQIPTITSVVVGSNCGFGKVNLSANSTIGTINWFDSSTSTTILTTGNTFTTPSLSSTKTYFVEAFNNGCSNGIRVPVMATINSLPITFDELVSLCENGFVDLDAQLTGVKYEWSTGETTQIIRIVNTGIYTVKLIDIVTNCFRIKTFTVTQIKAPKIKEVLIDYNKATIITEENGQYEFAVNQQNYQFSPEFYHLKGGLKTFSVKEINGCGIDFKEMFLLIIPRFITPNHDGFNDEFMIDGLSVYPDASIQIFDKFGKILFEQKNNSKSWNGFYNGNQLPSADYWYIIQLSKDLPPIKGHFTLKRN